MDMSRYQSLFLNDTAEHLDALEGNLLVLEGNPGDRESLDEVFRHLHSVKGMAASMHYEVMARLAHRLEDLASEARESGRGLSSPAVEVLLQGLDVLRVQLQAVRGKQSLPPLPEELVLALEKLQGGSRPPPEASAPPAQPAAGSEPARWLVEVVLEESCPAPALRAFVIVNRLRQLAPLVECRPSEQQLRAGQFPGNRLLQVLLGEAERSGLEALGESLLEVSSFKVEPLAPPAAPGGRQAAAAGPGPPPAARPATVRVGTELLDFFFDSVGELISLLSFFEEYSGGVDSRALRHGVRRLGQVVRRLRDRVVQVRMVPVSLLTARLPRVVRDLARQQDKQVDFTISGQEVELDRAIVEALDTPLLHLLRNAVDHGLEDAAARRARGKPDGGRLELSFQRAGERVQVRLRDDGAGIDLERVMQRARQQGLLADGERPGRQRLLELIFQPGFSTRERAGQVSGRGEGLDAVRRDIERLGGRVTVETVSGQGTTFFIDLPLTLAIVPVLLVEEAGAVLALPAQRVERVQAGHEDGAVRLAEILGGAAGGGAGECVVLGGAGGPLLRLVVERICGHREVVVKPLGRLLAAVGPYSGAAVLGDGRPALVLDVDELLRRRAGR